MSEFIDVDAMLKLAAKHRHLDKMNVRELKDWFLELLSKAQEQRPLKYKLVTSPDDEFPQLEWIVYERDVMFDAVNTLRNELGKTPINKEEILRAERCACGHVDYSKKFSLYCAELVLKGSD